MNKIKFLATFFVPALFSMQIAAQTTELPPIFDDVPREIFAAKTIAEFPAGTFLENIAVDRKGDLFVTSLEDGRIFRVSPADGAKNEFARVAGKIAGIVFDKKGNLIVTGWADGKTPSVFRVDKSGKIETLAAIDGAQFLNGIVNLKNDRFLIADSFRGAIWEFDARTKKYSIWLEDALLARSIPDFPRPGVNGLKIRGDVLFATNTLNRQILKIPILSDGKAGKPAVFAEKVNGDDFAIDGRGNLFVTTHVYDNVARVSPEGKVAVIAEADQGAAGATALAFGRGKSGKNAIYFVTNGGLSLPPASGVQTAKIVRLEISRKLRQNVE